ncbi:hypothetical protein [Candidatus Viridilinea mediisalina]|uniref:Uncharacterized protein n=1 Tax=Candidatus Viridilinea mediisalina TaxID=2024553 RepID=A0A2A6RKM6_9CHLR|nr:hypothetical protein [Candidatus Viridilinea mediisalina]PDW03592.1 hypothetical protein CJ255_07950 [Candidatus Viridilinea mediisalina]
MIRSYWFPLVIGLLIVLTSAAMLAALQPVAQPGAALDGVELLALTEVTQLEQRIMAEGEYLVGLRLGLKVDPLATELPLRLRLRHEGGLPRDLINLEVPLGATEQGVLEVRFAPIFTRATLHTSSPTLQLILEPPPLPEGADVRILVSRQTEPHGSVVVNGELDPIFALAFTPIYQHQRLDALWPVSRMAAQRPGPLGWPPFYPLLVGSFLVALMVALKHVLLVSRESG